MDGVSFVVPVIDHTSIDIETGNINDALRLIQQIDLSLVIERLIKVDKWKKKHALLAVKQYKNYLFLRKKYSEKNLPPSIEIDAAWHAHILHTKDYSIFCDQFFGYYLHHHPHIQNACRSISELEQMFELTQRLYKKEFGVYITTIKQPLLLKAFARIFKKRTS